MTSKKFHPITDRKQLKAGVYIRAIINCYANT